MKLLDIPGCIELNATLESGVDLGDRVLYGSVDAYSTKKAGDDKKLANELETKLVEDSRSPQISCSPLGSLQKSSTRKLLIDLISTMNATLGDYDFTSVSPESFETEQNQWLVINAINNVALDKIDKVQTGFKNKFWQVMDEAIQIDKCEIYRFNPDEDSELSANKLWSFYYFFFNTKEKRLVFFRCWEKNTANIADDEYELMGSQNTDAARLALAATQPDPLELPPAAQP